MDSRTGEIRELKVDEKPRPTEVELTQAEAERLLRLETSQRVAELARLRGAPITGKRARRMAIRARRMATGR